MGAFQIDQDEVMLFGGFNEGAAKRVLFYKTAVGQEGEFQEGQDLAADDFFPVNGTYLRLGNKQLVFPGHKQMHLFSPETKSFSLLKHYE